MKTITVIWMGLLAPVLAHAQYRCTMPNGIVTYSHLSTCPADAALAERIDRVPNVIPTQPARPVKPASPPEPQIVITPAQPAAPAKPAATTAQPPKERDIISESHGICALLRASGATTCDVHVNIFSPSYIDATVPTTPRDAQMTCLTIANLTRQPGSPFVGRGWRLKLFSPMGSGTRPMAECTL